ncbi:TetR/AcrR family transcriptional regulator [Nocardia sp. NPDC059239]|uniref:TetR/AcrR family transcriptional regulator n=1 Tax=unclassified Nocardia TaxID=2637762 RepID=UPI00367B101F
MRKYGLRERKKLSTRALIEQNALRLFFAQGFAETTIDQIGEAANVSSRTVSRYFASKEQIVLDGLVDHSIPDAVAEAPAELRVIEAARAVVVDLYESRSEGICARFTLIVRTPGLQNAFFDTFRRTTESLEEGIARRLGQRIDDPAVLTLAAAIMGTALAAFASAVARGETEFDSYLRQVERRLAELDRLLQV